MDNLEAPKWFRRNITKIRRGSLIITASLVELAVLFPTLISVSLLIAVVSLMVLFMLTLTIDPMPDWKTLLSVISNEKAKNEDEVVIHRYLSECYYDLWKWDMMTFNDESAQMAVLTSPSTCNKTIGLVDELIQENGEYFLKRYSRLKRYDGKYQVIVMRLNKEDSRMKDYLQKVDKPRYLEIYGDA